MGDIVVIELLSLFAQACARTFCKPSASSSTPVAKYNGSKHVQYIDKYDTLLDFDNIKLNNFINLDRSKITKVRNVNSGKILKLFPNVREIQFSDVFNKPIGTDIFSDQVKKIMFGAKFNYNIPDKVLPTNMVSLEFKNKLNNNLILTRSNIPACLRELTIPSSCRLEYIPKTLTKLIIDNREQDLTKLKNDNMIDIIKILSK